MKTSLFALCPTLIALTAMVSSAAELPLARVVLFSSGVGYFHHQGTVVGDTDVAMSFRVAQINDILKSMVLQDFDGGTIGAVTYAPQDPLDRTLQAFGVDIADNPSLDELLDRLRGAEIEVVAEETVRGTVLGVEEQQKSVGDDILSYMVVNLVTDAGIVEVPVWHMKSVRLLDEELSGDLNQALAAIAANRDVSKRQVSLSFMGDGNRQVAVGYLLETPVWKTTYRLVAEDEESFLQGWAIVENTTDEDWRNVRMALVSGRPISFVQNLYEPLYAYRPEVPVSVQVAAVPRVYEGAVDRRMIAEAEEAAAGERARRAEAPPSPGAAAPAEAMAKAAARAPGLAGGYNGVMMADALAQAGVAAAAAGEEVGELFQYAIEQPVSIARQGSAMIPIVNQAIEAAKVSIYNQNSNVKHPLHGLKLENTTGLHLMGGPITVFDGGTYAGDALIEDLGQGDDRLVSYAVDLGVEVVPKSEGGSHTDISLKISRGVLTMISKQETKMSYELISRADEERTVLVEHPRRDDWELVEPKEPEETTRSLYRFKVALAPEQTDKLTVIEQKQLSETARLTDQDVDQILVYIRTKKMSEQVKAALQRIVEMKGKIAGVAQQIADKEARLTEIGEEQARIRQNMEQLDHDSELYTKYVTKLTAQEDEFDKVRGEIAQLKEQLRTLEAELQDFIVKLNVE
jgi:hypothetical protein